MTVRKGCNRDAEWPERDDAGALCAGIVCEPNGPGTKSRARDEPAATPTVIWNFTSLCSYTGIACVPVALSWSC